MVLWTYNTDGTMKTQTKEDGTVLHYYYNGMGQLTSISASDLATGVIGTTAQAFEYNGLGARTKSTDNNDPATTDDDETATWCYDSLGRVVEEAQKMGPSGATYCYSSDYAGEQRGSLVYPDGRRVRYSLLAGGALGSVYDDGQAANAIASYSYIGGRTLKRAMQNGINLDMRNGSGGDYYDALGRPTRWAHVNAGAAGALVVGWERSYDRGGNAIAQRPLHDAKDSQRYAYDAAARLTAFSRGDFATGSLDPGSAAYCDAPAAGTWGDLARAQEWHLDGLGNWRTFVQKAGTAGAQPVSEARVDNPFNQYASIGGAAQTYDANGNLLVGSVGPAGEARQLKWDAFNRLREVRMASGGGGGGEGTLIASYVYDAGNRRVRKAVAAGSGVPGAGTSTDYYYTGWQIGETRNPAVSPSAPLRQFVFGNYIDEPLAMDVNGQQTGTGSGTCIGTGDARYFYHANPIFSVAAITNASGAGGRGL